MARDPLHRQAINPDDLGERARQILRALVHEHLETGEPVASRSLARQPGIVLSPASVRAVLNDLEALGYLDKPHTSAGRLPTEKGFRFYATALIKLPPQPPAKARGLIDQRLDPARVLPSDALFQEASRLLHALTRHAGVITPPRPDERYRSFDFVPLRGGRVLAVCVTESGQVKNRLLSVDFEVGPEQIESASRLLGALLSEGRTLDELRTELSRQLDNDQARADALQAAALALSARALADDEEPPPMLVIEGQTSLLDDPRLAANLDRLRQLFHVIEEKKHLARLLEQTTEARELTLFVGDETGLGPSGDIAVIAAPYGNGEKILGAVGVIGPARMAYGRVIPIVQYTAQALSRTLDEG